MNHNDLGDIDWNKAREDGARFTAFPAGWYVVFIEKAEVKANRQGNGKMVAVQAQVLSDGYKGRKLFFNLNHIHPNEQTQNIAKRHLNSMFTALGIPDTARCSAALINKTVGVKLSVQKDDDSKNNTDDFKPAAEVESSPAAARSPFSASARTPPPAGATPPPAADTAASAAGETQVATAAGKPPLPWLRGGQAQ